MGGMGGHAGFRGWSVPYQGSPGCGLQRLASRCRRALLVQHQHDEKHSGSGSLVSQLTYSGLTGQSGEFFARVDAPSQIFIKGLIGAGAITGGNFNDEDWGVDEGIPAGPENSG